MNAVAEHHSRRIAQPVEAVKPPNDFYFGSGLIPDVVAGAGPAWVWAPVAGGGVGGQSGGGLGGDEAVVVVEGAWAAADGAVEGIGGGVEGVAFEGEGAEVRAAVVEGGGFTHGKRSPGVRAVCFSEERPPCLEPGDKGGSACRACPRIGYPGRRRSPGGQIPGTDHKSPDEGVQVNSTIPNRDERTSLEGVS